MSQFETLTAPMLAGTQANWLLLGTLTLQVYKFHICFPNERTWLKALVYTIFCLEVAQTGITSHFAYSILVVGWGNPAVFEKLPWSSLAVPIFTGITSATVQIFFAGRIWILKRNEVWARAVASLIILLAFMQSLAAIISDAKFAATTEVAELASLVRGVKVWLYGSAVCDFLITFTMLFILTQYRRNTPWKKTDSLLTKLIYNTVETGAVTSLVAIADAVLFTKFPDNNIHQVPAFMLGKLYSNVLLASVNARAQDGTPSERGDSRDNTRSHEIHEMQWRVNRAPPKVHISTVTNVSPSNPIVDSKTPVYTGVDLTEDPERRTRQTVSCQSPAPADARVVQERRFHSGALPVYHAQDVVGAEVVAAARWRRTARRRRGAASAVRRDEGLKMRERVAESECLRGADDTVVRPEGLLKELRLNACEERAEASTVNSPLHSGNLHEDRI
ncbi:hypothetical protein K438DRAFT_1983452 [Mycena galopus ATCC 62051]|nr:hypothetical protein K438DRAFT_1995648 [Mycena galopus ATCC 62051]KAF8169133.1 hypothetical protein K438DRAFT_1983452 [Mycena galopus ATCC 62051]